MYTQSDCGFELLSAVYTIDNEGLEKDGAVVGFASEFVNHACVSPDGLLLHSLCNSRGGGGEMVNREGSREHDSG
jgi:hypothetical protein